MHKKAYNWMDKQLAMRSYYQQLQNDNEVTQITVTNCTDVIRKVCLWGANACVPLTDPVFINTTISKTVSVQRQPQELIYNPVNDAFYVVNQFSDSVTVISPKGIIIKTIPLVNPIIAQDPAIIVSNTTFLLPGTKSPTSLAVNTKSDSTEYGMVAVACSVSNEVFFINTDFTINRVENVEIRPIDIVYNAFNDCYFTANLVSGSITKICTLPNVNSLPPIESARTLGVNDDNGDLYVHSIKTGEITIYDSVGNFKGSVGSVISDIISFSYHPINKQMYIGLNNSNLVLVIDPVTFGATIKIAINNPVTLAYNPHDNLMYVGSGEDQTLTRVNLENQIVDAIKIGDFGLGLAISAKENLVAVSDASTNTVTISGEGTKPAVTVNEEYYEYREDFQHNPTLIEHVKISASGEDRLNTLQLIEESVYGKESCDSLSLSNYQSPQNFCNIYEVFEMDGNIIDGHITWCFKINPKQVVTFLIYHKQFEMYNVLPEKTRVATGVEMSKGIPETWHDNNQN